MISIKKKPKDLPSTNFPLHGEKEYHLISMENFVQHSQVRRVYFHKNILQELYDWMVEFNENSGKKSVVEIGGFFLGGKTEKDGGFDVFVEKFLKAEEVDFQSNNSLVMGAKVFDALDDAMEESKYLELVGWFHTHPGHGPYLSEIDLQKVQGILFMMPFSIALVIDPLTQNFDAGLFTYQKDGTLNNAKEFSPWLAWKKLTDK